MTPNESTGAQLLGPERVGSFVRTTTLGIGRLVRLDSDIAHVQYFQAPGRSPYVEYPHPTSEVSLTHLAAQTRAYLYDGQRWRIGRVEGLHPQDQAKYLVAFPNSEGAILASESFDVRWDM